MKGIILAGGSGTRLYPITKAISKQLLPLYDKPMIYYPVSVLMLAGIREILIISNPEYIENYKSLLGTGEKLGLRFEYKIQEQPRGLADAFIVGEEFIGNDDVCLILGDNIFYGQGFSGILKKVAAELNGATVFGYWVNNPEEFGVFSFNENKKIIDIEEKPKNPKSNFAVPGLYFYNNDVIKYAKELEPSPRGEIEITDLNRRYLSEGKLNVELLGRGFAWLDTGTYDGLLKASNFVRTVQKRQGLYVACLEEIAYLKSYISKEQLKELGSELSKTDYGQYLLHIAEDKFLH